MPQVSEVAAEQVRDERRPPFCYQTHEALDAIRAHYARGAKYGKSTVALGIYLAFTEAANRLGGDPARNGFTSDRTYLAHLAGMSPSGFDRYIPELVAAGVLTVEQRQEGKANLPNLWTLIDPPRERTPLRVDAETPLRAHAEEELKKELKKDPPIVPPFTGGRSCRAISASTSASRSSRYNSK